MQGKEINLSYFWGICRSFLSFGQCGKIYKNEYQGRKNRMKKAILLIFLLVYILCPAAQAAAAVKPVPWQLKRRIIFSMDECFIVRDKGRVFMNRAAGESFSEVA